MGSSPSSANLYFDAWRIPKHRIFASLVLIPRTFGTIGTLERLEPALVFNGLNVLNGLQHSLAANSTGDYRVVYEIDDARKRVRIFRIRHRREVYR